MRPLFPFYGSKWRDAKRYGSPASHVIEPFAGSAGYSTYWEPERVTLVDADPIIVSVWSFLIASTEADIRRLPDLQPDQSVLDLNLPQEAKWFIGFWLNRGSSQPKLRHTNWAFRSGRERLVWGEWARARVASSIHKVDGWKVRQGDYTESPVDPAATYFIDPPYVDKGRHYRVNDVDHRELGPWCQSLPGHVIACEQQGADWLPFRPLAAVKSTRGISHEAVWDSRSVA